MDARLLVLKCLFFIFSIAVARKGHMAPLGESGTITPLPLEMQGFPDPAHFLKEHVLQNKPLIMRGAALDMPATKVWSDEYMKAKIVGNDQQIMIEYGKKETRKGGSKMTFSEFLSKYNDSDIYYVNAVPNVLSNDVIIPWPLQCKEYERSFEDNVMWFSSGGTKSVIHHDGYENINCLLRGRKRFLFVNTTKYEDIEGKIIDIEEGSYGSVDVEKVDLDKYPFYEGMEFFSADMNEGDCVYSPKQWIHQVESWGSNIAVNVWWFSEINELVKPENCNREFNRSMTFKAVTFHRTTEITSGDVDREIAIHALRHGISRFVFTTSKSRSVNIRQFAKILTRNRTIPSSEIHNLVTIFQALDTNRNNKLEVTDLQHEISAQKSEKLLDRGGEWLSVARIRDYPIPVDFSNDSYKTIKPFMWSEVVEEMEDEGEEMRDEERKSDKTPKQDPVLKTSVGDREEL